MKYGPLMMIGIIVLVVIAVMLFLRNDRGPKDAKPE